ncbi:hypothetical protein [Streptomyces sp. NPDC001492]
MTVADISAARQRVVEFLTRTRHVSGFEAVRGEDTWMPLPAPDESQTVEQRVEALEQWAREMPRQIEQRDDHLADFLTLSYQGELEAARKTVNDQLDGLQKYIKGTEQSTWDSYKGPILLVLGVLVGTAANFTALS